jgi:hypothetical protein
MSDLQGFSRLEMFKVRASAVPTSPASVAIFR